jgi:2-polyprenyl-3-methyl-5-hydroxy-6-metoxy-1,4-benzoquinol methylase
MVRKYASLTLKLNQGRMKVVSEFFKDMGSGLTVLDVGCGDGAMGEYVAGMGNHVVSIDLPEIIALSRGNRVLSLTSGDAEPLAFAPESFDAVIALDVLDHLWKPPSFLEEAYRVLKPKKPLIISAPEGERGMDYDAHKNFFTVESIKGMIGSRFTIREIKRVQPLGTPTPMIIMLLQKKASEEDS